MTTRRRDGKQLLAIAREIDELERRMAPMRQRLRELHGQLEARYQDAVAAEAERDETVEALRRRLNFVPTPEAESGIPQPTQTTAFGIRVSVPHDIYSTQPMQRWVRRRGPGAPVA